jgi:hypothetical protein
LSFRDGESLISEYRRLHDIKNDIVDRLKSDKVTKQMGPGIRNTNR